MDARLLRRKLQEHDLHYSEQERAYEVVSDLIAERDRLRDTLASIGRMAIANDLARVEQKSPTP